jgi:ATP-dependent helicase/nuclease subunit A
VTMMTTLREPADAAARRQALDLAQSFLVEAPAGSGKTELLTQRALACLAVVNDPEEVVAVTFTNKAANEMRTRIMRALIAAAAGKTDGELPITMELARKVLARDADRGWSLLTNPARLRITTIDAFNAFLASQVPLLSGLGGPTRVEPNASPLYREAVFRLAAGLDDDSTDAVTQDALHGLFAFAQNRLDRLMPFLTSMLASREQWLPQVASEAAALLRGEEAQEDHTDSLLAAVLVDELNSALRVLPADLRQQVAMAVREQASEPPLAWAQRLDGWPGARIELLDLWRSLASMLLTQDGGLRARVTVREGFPPKAPATAVMKELLAELHGRADLPVIEGALRRIRALPDPQYPSDMRALRGQIAVALLQLVAHLKLAFQQAGKVDFPEMAMRALAALDDAEGYAEAKERLDYQIFHLLIDEMQDTSASQMELLRRLTVGWADGDGRTLFMVGDPKQSIYAFRQAEVSLFERLRAARRFGDLTITTVSLSANFRSEASIVQWCNEAFELAFPAETDTFTGAVGYTPSVAHIHEALGDGVVAHGFRAESPLSEAEGVVALIKQTLDIHPDWSIAVLARARRHVHQVLDVLKREGISFACTDIDPLASTDPVRDVKALVRALWHPADRGAWVQLLRAPFVGLSWTDITALVNGSLNTPIPVQLENATGLSAEGSERVQQLCGALAASEQNEEIQGDLLRRAEAVWLTLGGPACVGGPEAADVQRLFALLREHLHGGQITDIHAFELAVSHLYAAPGAGKVQVMTVHKAKGLEFDRVILVGLGEGTQRDDAPLFYSRALRGKDANDAYLVAPNPGRSSEDDGPAQRLFDYMGDMAAAAQAHEQRRVLYVAATRARKSLHLFVGARLGETGGPSPKKGSFAEILWEKVGPAIARDFEILEEGISGAEPAQHVERQPPLSPRLPVGWTLPSKPTVWDEGSHKSLPTEQVLQAPTERFEDAALHGLEAMEGSVYHALLARISPNLARWEGLTDEARRKQVHVTARQAGIPGDALESSVDRVMALVAKTLASEQGRWLLQPRSNSENEFPLVGYYGGRWVSVVLDRCFVDGDDLWIVDYKTAEIAGADVDARVNEEMNRHQDQLGRYRDAVSKHPLAVGKNIRRGLFLASLGRLEEYK